MRVVPQCGREAEVFVQTMFETSKLLIELKTLGFLYRYRRNDSLQNDSLQNNRAMLIAYNL